MYSYEEGAGESSEYFVAVSELVQYKRIDLAIEAMRGLDAKLIVVGSGEQRKALEKDSPPNVEFRGRVPDEGLRDLYRGAKALIFPGEEDFGIVPVEAMSCGTPIIAYGAGGIRDSVVENETGLFFERQELSAVQEAIARFETMTFDRKAIAHHAQSFSRNNFKAKFKSIVDMELAKVKPS
jgi:glycosyltransferase involved in cell wall biosynthesis